MRWLVLLVFTLAAWPPKTLAAAQPPVYQGPKQTISILAFENKVQGVLGSAALGEGMTEILTTALVNSDRFVVLDRQNLKEIVGEQGLAMTGLVNEQTGVKTGQMAGAQFFIKGAVTEFNPEAGGRGVSVGFKKGKVGGKSIKAHVGIDVRLVDNATGQIFASYHASATARQGSTELGTSIFHNNDPFQLGVSGFKSTALGIAVRQAIEKVVVFILAESARIPWQGSVIRADGDRIYINRGQGSNIRSGQRLAIFAPGVPLIDPETGFNLGSDEEFVCVVEIGRVAPKFSIANAGASCRGRMIDRGHVVRLEAR